MNFNKKLPIVTITMGSFTQFENSLSAIFLLHKFFTSCEGGVVASPHFSWSHIFKSA